MRFFTLMMIAVPTMVLACTDESTNILSELSKTNKDSKALNTTLTKISNTAAPTANQEISLLNGANTLSADLNQTLVYCQESCTTTAAETTKAFKYLSNTLLPTTQSILKNFQAHHPGFQKAGIDSIVESSLQQQKSLVDQVGACLVSIGSGKSLSGASALQAKFDAAFTSAINTFST